MMKSIDDGLMMVCDDNDFLINFLININKMIKLKDKIINISLQGGARHCLVSYS
jgi:hypothetical protein